MTPESMQKAIKAKAKAVPLAHQILKGNGKSASNVVSSTLRAESEAMIVSPFAFLSQGLADA